MGNGMNGMIPPLPIPPLEGDTLIKIVKMVKAAWDIFTDSPAETLSETAPVNDSPSLDDVGHIAEAFTELKEQARAKSAGIESSVKGEVAGYLDEIRTLLEEGAGIAGRYGIRLDRMEKKTGTALRYMDGTIDHEIAKKISLDNPACRQVMGMLPGTKKEQALQAFWKEALQGALEAYCSGIRKLLVEILEEIEEETEDAIAAAEKISEASCAQLKNVDAENYQEETGKIIRGSYCLLGVCAAVDEVLGEG